MPNTLLTESLVVIIAAAGAIGLVKRVGFPPILGYLLAGLAIGPHGLAVLAPSEGTAFLSELGVVLLMFMVGLEFSLPKMIAARATVFGAGACQVALTTLGVALAARLLGAGWLAAVVMGGVVAMSSTAIMLKQLSDEGELGSQHGRLAVGILLFQDLATLPFLVLVGASGEDFGALTLSGQLLAAALAFVLIAVVGRPVFRTALAWAAQRRSPELFLLCSLALALGTAFAAQAAGLSAPIGAFWRAWPSARATSGIKSRTMSVRSATSWSACSSSRSACGSTFGPRRRTARGARLDRRVPRRQGGARHPGGRGPALAGPGRAARRPHPGARRRVRPPAAHPGDDRRHDRAASGPGDARRLGAHDGPRTHPDPAQRCDRRPRRDRGHEDEEAVPPAGHALEDHVILCGCGRVGRLVALVLEAAKVPYIGIESDLSRFREAKRAGHHAVFGDASRARTLHRVGVQRARLLAVTFDERRAVERLLHHARHDNAGIVAIVSAGRRSRAREHRRDRGERRVPGKPGRRLGARRPDPAAQRPLPGAGGKHRHRGPGGAQSRAAGPGRGLSPLGCRPRPGTGIKRGRAEYGLQGYACRPGGP